jgi:hypothetical protein
VGEVENVRICFFKEPCYLFLFFLNSNEGKKKKKKKKFVDGRVCFLCFYFFLLMDVCVNYASMGFLFYFLLSNF